MDVKPFLHVLSEFVEVPPVGRRKYDGLHAAPPRRYRLLLDLVAEDDGVRGIIRTMIVWRMQVPKLCA